MLKIFFLACIICCVHSWDAKSWTGRDWQSNSGRGWGGGGWNNGWNGNKWDGEDDGSYKGDNYNDGDDGKWNGNGNGGWGGWGGNNGDDGKDQWAPAQYSFGYGVADGHTGDKKEQTEERLGDVVKGQYSLKEADGTRRIVKYEADKGGFNAKVIQEGTAWHPQARSWGGDDGGWGGKGGWNGGWGGNGGYGGNRGWGGNGAWGKNW
nr:putative glycine-rich cell wall structural protein 1 [Onthophagus taurus]